MWTRNLSRTLVIAAACTVFCCAPSTSEAATGLKSAYLGASVWENNLDGEQVNTQLRGHFTKVIERLEAKNASSLLTALTRAEASSNQRWTKAERKQALIFLTKNRQAQIARLREYADRGLFPINEGQSHQAVPIFVDRHNTHCAVGYLMHVDGSDSEVAEVVAANNLVKVMDAQLPSLSGWIRTSGLTREEAAMIQPGYPINLDATFQDLATTTPTVTKHGLTLSAATIRQTRFTATLPASFRTDPSAIDDILAQGKAALENNDVFNVAASFAGVLFGTEGSDAGFIEDVPNNLDDWLYIGPSDAFLSGLVYGATPSGNVGIVEIEYELRSNRGDFSQIALSSSDKNVINGEQSALLILSEIFDGDTSELLGEASLFATGIGPASNSSSSWTYLEGSEAISLTSESVRIRTYGLVAGDNCCDAPLHSFFNEFETVLLGDFDGDDDVDVDDLDQYNQNIGAVAAGALLDLDLDSDGIVGVDDFETHYEELVMTSNGQVGTAQGDINLDGRVDVLNDAFVLVSNLSSTSITSWSQGDVNGDGDVNILGDAFALVGNLGFSNTP